MHKIHSLLLCLLITVGSSVSAAGPITHALLGYIWLEECGTQYTDADKKAFLIGTLFPDIRYLTHDTRESTHLGGISLKRVAEEPDPFTAGVKFHAWADDLREAYMHQRMEMAQKRKDQLEGTLTDITSVLRSSFLKYLEDEIYFGDLDWHDLITFLRKLEVTSPSKTISESTLKEWYALLVDQFELSPGVFFQQLGKEGKSYLDLPARTLTQWAKLLAHDAHNPVYQKHAADMLAFFKDKIKDCSSEQVYEWAGGGWVSWLKKIAPTSLKKFYLEVIAQLQRILGRG
jgi:hypothetical protein